MSEIFKQRPNVIRRRKESETQKAETTPEVKSGLSDKGIERRMESEIKQWQARKARGQVEGLNRIGEEVLGRRIQEQDNNPRQEFEVAGEENKGGLSAQSVKDWKREKKKGKQELTLDNLFQEKPQGDGQSPDKRAA